ncbi:MAG: hypothetical protein K6G50_08760 [bacterium]|nr:hypothetical protein [bacterium]
MSIIDSLKSKLTSAVEAVKSSAAPAKSAAPATINTNDSTRTTGKATAGSTVVASLDGASEPGNVSFASMSKMVHGEEAPAVKPENGTEETGSAMGGGLTSTVEIMAKVMRDQGASEEEIQAMRESYARQDQEMFSRMFTSDGHIAGGLTGVTDGNAGAGDDKVPMQGTGMTGGGMAIAMNQMADLMRKNGVPEEEIQAMYDRVRQQDQEMFGRMFGNTDAGKEGVQAPQGGGLTSSLNVFAQFMRDQGASEEEIQAMYDRVHQQDQEMFSRMFTKEGHLAGGLAGIINGNAGSAEEGSSGEPVPSQPGHAATSGNDPENPTIPGLEPWTPSGNHDPGFTPTIPTLPGVQIPDGLKPGNQDPGFNPPTLPLKPEPGQNPPLQPLPGQNPPPGLEPWTPTPGQNPTLPLEPKPGLNPVPLMPVTPEPLPNPVDPVNPGIVEPTLPVQTLPGIIKFDDGNSQNLVQGFPMDKPYYE